MTANELAARFEVSRRTILRDIDALTTAGIPIYTAQGRGGGIFIEERFMLSKTLLSEEEQKQILFSLQSMSATELAQTGQVLNRLRSLFAGPVREWIEVDFSRWGHSEADNAKFGMLKNAITNELAVSFNYINASGEFKARQVYPLKLSFKSKAWYLKSFCLSENDYRAFKFNRMSDMMILETLSFASRDYEPPEIEPQDGHTPNDLVNIKLLVLSHAKHRIYDEFAESDITVNADGTFTLAMTKGQWIYDYLLSYGPAVTVLEPQSIRDELLLHIEKIKSKYLPKI